MGSFCGYLVFGKTAFGIISNFQMYWDAGNAVAGEEDQVKLALDDLALHLDCEFTVGSLIIRTGLKMRLMVFAADVEIRTQTVVASATEIALATLIGLIQTRRQTNKYPASSQPFVECV